MKNSRFPLSGSVTLALGITTGFVLLISILLIFTTGWKASDAMLLVSLLCTSISLFPISHRSKTKIHLSNTESMTLTNQQIHPSDKTKLFNRFMYGAFVMSSLYFAFVSKDLMAAMSNFGIALIFDPFDQKIMWNNRPLYQRVWLLVHLCILFGLMSFLIFQYFRR